MPQALEMSCALGTSKMLCVPGTSKMSCAPGMEMFALLLFPWTKFTLQICMTSWLVSEATSLSRCTVLPGICLLSSLVRSWSTAIIPPGNTIDHLPWTTMSSSGSWTESSWYTQLYRCTEFVMATCIDSHMLGGWLLGKCCTFLFCSQQKKSISVWLCKSVVGWPTYASWWCYWVASWWNDRGWLLSTCHKPHTGCQNLVVVGVTPPLQRRGSCSEPMAVVER